MFWSPQLKIIMLATILVGTAPRTSLATTFSAANDLSPTNNPNNAWTYGWSSALGSTFSPYIASPKFNYTIDLWTDITKTWPPFIFHNLTPNIDNSHPTITFEPNQLAFHPGYYGEYSIVRWTAPETGNFSLQAMFSGLDHIGITTTDVHILHNGELLFSSLINGFGSASTKSFATEGMVEAGDTIDFAIGYGSNQTHWYDSTGLDGTIATSPVHEVPENSSCLAFSAFGAAVQIKRKLDFTKRSNIG